MAQSHKYVHFYKLHWQKIRGPMEIIGTFNADLTYEKFDVDYMGKITVMILV